MAKSANRTTNPIMTPRTDTQLLFAHLAGAGVADLALDAQEALNGEILSAVRTGPGVYTIAFRYAYPELKQAPVASFGPSVTAGIDAVFSAINIQAGTGTLNTFVGSTPTDLAVGDVIYLAWSVRNSGRNK